MPRRPSPDTTIGERIRNRRQLRSWSVRHAADRAGVSPSTWSRIEWGLMSADNRFILAAIAEALECSISDLTGTPVLPSDRETMAAQACVYAMRQALIDVDLAEAGHFKARPMPELEREAALVRDLRARCDYAGVGRLAPRLLRELHAVAGGPDRAAALRLTIDVAYVASAALKYLGYPAEAWLAAERSHEAAKTLEDPVLLAMATFGRAHAATARGSYDRAWRLGPRGGGARGPPPRIV